MSSVRKIFSDIDDSLTMSSDGTIKILENGDSIKQSIITILSTAKGERLMLPQFGSGIRRLLFDPLDDITARILKAEIISVLGEWEDRISVRSVEVVPDYDNNRYVILIDYIILKLQQQDQFITGVRAK